MIQTVLMSLYFLEVNVKVNSGGGTPGQLGPASCWYNQLIYRLILFETKNYPKNQWSHINPQRPPFRGVSPEGVKFDFEIEMEELHGDLQSNSIGGCPGQPGPAWVNNYHK